MKIQFRLLVPFQMQRSSYEGTGSDWFQVSVRFLSSCDIHFDKVLQKLRLQKLNRNPNESHKQGKALQEERDKVGMLDFLNGLLTHHEWS
jgi:hypothetical protein